MWTTNSCGPYFVGIIEYFSYIPGSTLMFFHCSPNIALSWNMSLVDPYSITTSVSHSWATSASCFAVWTTLPEGILWCTDPFTEPPIPSATLFLCEVAKKCHYFIQEFLLPKFKVQEKIRLPELGWWTIKQKNKLSLSCHNFSPIMS